MESNTLERLFEPTLKAAYWLGYIMADGSISDKRLKLTSASQDIEQVYRLAEFLGAKAPRMQRRGTIVCVSCQDPLKIPLIRNRFDIHSRKTYNPPRVLPFEEADMLVAFLVGLTDGDGCIQYQSGRLDCKLTIKLHASWGPFLSALDGALSGLGTLTNSSGYIQYGIFNNEVLSWLRAFAEYHRLPILRRKWDKIDMERASQRRRLTARRVVARNMLMGGARPWEVSRATGLSSPDVSRLRRQLGIAPFKRGKNAA